MSKYIGKRLLMMVPVLLGVMVIVFSINYFTPGDPARMILGDGATPEALEQLRGGLLGILQSAAERENAHEADE